MELDNSNVKLSNNMILSKVDFYHMAICAPIYLTNAVNSPRFKTVNCRCSTCPIILPSINNQTTRIRDLSQLFVTCFTFLSRLSTFS